MSAYSELTQRFSEYRKAQIEQLHRLCTQACNFTTALEKFLELPELTWVDPKSGAEMSYVRLGTGSAQNFDEKDSHELASNNGAVEFSVSVTLEGGPNQFPKRHHIFQLKVTATADGYLFSTDDFEGSLVVGSGVQPADVYDPLCSSLVQTLINGYDVSRIL